MNQERRKRIDAIAGELQTIAFDLAMLADEEEEAYHSTPAGLQGSDQAQAMESAAHQLEELQGELSDLEERLAQLAE